MKKNIVELVMEAQVNSTNETWGEIIEELQPVVDYYARYAPLEDREDLAQVIWIEVMRCCIKFKFLP